MKTQDSNDKKEGVNRHSVQRIVSHPDETQNSHQESGLPLESESLITDRRTSIAGEYVNLLLPQLLAILEHPKIAADLVPDLAQNSQHREHLTALGNLWRSLGRPTSGFWRHTYVFCNGIQDDSYLRAMLMANDRTERHPPRRDDASDVRPPERVAEACDSQSAKRGGCSLQ